MGQTAQQSTAVQPDATKLKKLRAQAAALYKRGQTKSAIKAQQRLVDLAGDEAPRTDWAFLGLYYFAAGPSCAVLKSWKRRWRSFPIPAIS